MKLLHFDLETIPAQKKWVMDSIKDNIRPPGTIKKVESIKKWMDEKSEEAIKNEWLKTSFNGAVGEIICIGHATNDDNVEICGRKLSDSEGDMLQDFADNIANKINNSADIVWCGHYITGFDLHFLWQRMVVNNIKMPFSIPHTAKPWSNNVFDTCHEWKMDSRGFGSLDMALKCLSIEKTFKDDFDGSMVWEAVKNEEYNKVYEYCKGDVQDARNLYRRLQR